VEGDTLTVYASLPAHGHSAEAGKAAELGVRLALADAGRRIGGRTVRLTVLPSTRPGDETWDPGTIETNAERAVEDPTTIAYLGELDQGGSAVSLPVTNDAGILQLSPADGLTSLGRSLPGETQDRSQRYYPAGGVTFGRFVAPDLDAARRIADSLEARGVRRLAVLHETGISSRELESMVRAELGLGSTTLESTRIAVRDAEPDHVADVVERVGAARSQAVLYAGGGRSARAIMAALAAAGLDVPVVGGPALAAAGSFDRAPEGACAWTGVPRARDLPPRGQRLLARLRRDAGRSVGVEAVLGYAAMEAALQAVERAGPDRRAVVRAALRSVDRDEVVVGHGLGSRAHVEESSTACVPLAAGERASALADGGAQRPLELRLAEAVAQLLQPGRHGPDPGGHDLGHLAVERLHRQAGDGRERGAPQHATERPRQFPVGDRLGRREVDGAQGGIGVQAEQHGADDVVGVDPGDVLPPAGDRPPDAQLERRQHLLQRAARLGQDHAGARNRHAHPELLGRGGLGLPLDADLREEVVRRRGRLVYPLVAVRPVVAGRRL
jgi:branched-chain amino acid transport system substrate-binding protein